MSLPKVLIFGQPFNNRYGGGITLSNLFRGWDKDRIAVAATGHVMKNVKTDICDIYFQLGSGEYKWHFPFNLLQRKFKSGLILFDKISNATETTSKAGLRFKLVNNYFYPVMEWIGLFHYASHLELSNGFKYWLAKYKPDVLYLQVSSRIDVLFAQELHDYLKIPTAIHMMDDWTSAISKKGLFKKYWANKIDKEFRSLLGCADLFLSISDAMTSEYKKRYNKVFTAFHNPICVYKYTKNKYHDFKYSRTFKILYIGRIGIANKISIYTFAEAISHFEMESTKITFDIYTPDFNSLDSNRLRKLDCVKVHSAINHEEVPELLKKYSLLLLPLDFTEHGLRYSRYSMPTKASEYMASGTPILVFAPAVSAISQFCSENECGFCVTEQNQEELNNALKLLINDIEYRKKLSNNAVKIAFELFDADKVRQKFQSLLINL